MKKLLILIPLLISCGHFNRMIDTVEYSHYMLYDHTKALNVLGTDNNRFVVESFTKQAVYILREDSLQIGDTIYLNQNPDIFGKLRFTSFKNLYFDFERGYYTFIGNHFYEGNTLKELKKDIKNSKL
jgi:hypothetical protein